MAPVVAERVWRPSTPPTIEHDLAEVWRDIGAKEVVARAMMSNLVIVRAVHLERRAGVSIDAVAAQHPSRVLIIDHEPPGDGPCEISHARVGVVTYGPPGARYGVEQIAVRSSCTDESLASLIRRLVRGDLPMSVWWAEDLSMAPPLGSIVEMGRQLVYDSRLWHDVRSGVRALEPWQRLDLADVNWRRLAAIRRAVILAAGMRGSGWSPDDIRIAHRPESRSLAWLLVGWLSSRLRWPSDRVPHVESVEESEPMVVSIGRDSDPIRIRADGRQVLVEGAGGHPAAIGVPHEGEADAVAAELHSLSHDGRLHDALRALHRHFSAA